MGKNKFFYLKLWILFGWFSAKAGTICQKEEFFNYVKTANLAAFKCSNLDQLINLNLWYGQRPLHIAILKRNRTHKDFLKYLLQQNSLDFNVIDDNDHPPLTLLVKTYQPDEDALLQEVAFKTQSSLVVSSMVHSQYTRYADSPTEDVSRRVHMLDLLYASAVAVDRKEMFGVGLELPNAFFKALMGSSIVHEVSLEDIMIDHCQERILKKWNEKFAPNILIDILWETAYAVDSDRKDRGLAPVFIEHLVRRPDVDMKYPRNERDQEKYYQSRVTPVIDFDLHEELILLIDEMSLPIKAQTRGRDLLQLALENKARESLKIVLQRFQSYHYAIARDQQDWSYVHNAIDTEDFKMFKVVVDHIILAGFKAEIRLFKDLPYGTAYEYVTQLAEASPSHEAFAQMKAYLEHLGLQK